MQHKAEVSAIYEEKMAHLHQFRELKQDLQHQVQHIQLLIKQLDSKEAHLETKYKEHMLELLTGPPDVVIAKSDGQPATLS